MNQTFTANEVKTVTDTANSVVVTGWGDLDDRGAPRCYLTITRSTEEVESGLSNVDIEFNEQTNISQPRDISKLTFSSKQCVIEFANTAQLRSGTVDRPGTEKLKSLVIETDLTDRTFQEIAAELKKCFPAHVLCILP